MHCKIKHPKQDHLHIKRIICRNMARPGTAARKTAARRAGPLKLHYRARNTMSTINGYCTANISLLTASYPIVYSQYWQQRKFVVSALYGIVFSLLDESLCMARCSACFSRWWTWRCRRVFETAHYGARFGKIPTTTLTCNLYSQVCRTSPAVVENAKCSIVSTCEVFLPAGQPYLYWQRIVLRNVGKQFLISRELKQEYCTRKWSIYPAVR